MANNKTKANARLVCSLRASHDFDFTTVKTKTGFYFSTIKLNGIVISVASLSSKELNILLNAIACDNKDVVDSYLNTSVSETKTIQRCNARGNDMQQRTYVKSNVNKKETSNPETTGLTDLDLKDMLFDFDYDLVKIRQSKIEAMSEFFTDYIDFDNKSIQWNNNINVIKINEDKFITQFNLDKIEKLMERLERVNDEMARMRIRV